MPGFLARRLLSFLATLAAAAVAVFLVLEVLPGDPAAFMLGTQAQPDTLAALRLELGLDRPALARFFSWLAGLVTGDLGTSYTYRVPVAQLIAERAVVTLPLALMAITLSTALGIPLGLFAASRHNRPGDYGVMGFAQLGVAVPNFWIGILLILLFSIQLGWFSAGGFPGWSAGIWPGLKALILPALALGLAQAAQIARVARAAVLEIAQEDFLRTAHAKGLSRSQALWRHGLRHAMVPVVTVMGMQFSVLVAGAILIENVFTLPGLGRLVYQAMAQRDLMVVQTVALALAGLVIAMNFLVDLAYVLLDPRLRRP